MNIGPAADSFDQVRSLRQVVGLHRLPVDLRRIHGIGRVAGEQFPSDGLTERLFQNPVHVPDGSG